MKIDPDAKAAPDISSDSQRITDWLKDCVKRIKDDFDSRAEWVQAKEHFLSRRYCTAWRNPTTPWVNSSNIVIPFIDKKIDELKPQYVNIVTAANPPVTVMAVQPQFQEKTKNVELLFEWLVNHSSPRFVEEVTLSVDDCLEIGRSVIRDYWHYESRQTPSILTAARLPGDLKRLIVTANNDREADNLFIASGGQGGGAAVLTKRDFDRMHDGIKEVVLREFDLDEDEPRDQKAINLIMGWLRGGARGDLRYESRDVIASVPAIRAVSPLDFIVPENATDNIEEHERFVEVMYFTEQQLRATVIDQKLDKGAFEALLDKRKKGSNGNDGRNGRGRSNTQRNQIDIEQASREGLTGSGRDDLIEIWKLSTWLSTESGGRDKKVNVLLPAEAPEHPLKIKAHARASGHWGYHSYSFEHNKRRWYSPRGVPEKIDDIDAEITAQHRAKLNRMAIVNSPTLKFKPGRHINPTVWKFWPGQMFPTADPMGDVIPVEFQNMDVSFDNEAQIMQTYGESYLGGPDYGLTGNSTLSEARTATEINSINAQARQSLSMRGILFKRGMNGVWREWFNQWHSIGPEDAYVKVTGGDAPIRLTKEDLQGQFILQCTGTIGSSDPVLEAQKAQNRIIILAQVGPLLGDQWELNLGEAVVDWMEKDNIRLMKRVLRKRSPEEVRQIQQQKQQLMAQQKTQELALAAAGQKPSKNGKASENGKSRGVAPIPPLGSRN